MEVILRDKYELSDEKQGILNEVTTRWKFFRIKETSQDPYIWLNELFNLNFKFKKNEGKYEKDEDEMKSYVFDILSEEYKLVRVLCDVNISKMEYKDIKKEICWF